MTRAIGRILKTHMAEHRDHRPLTQGCHSEWEITFGDAELAEGINDRHKTHLAQAGSGANHIGLGDADFNEAALDGFLKSGDSRGTLHVGRHRKHRRAFLCGPNGALRQTSLNFALLDRRRIACGRSRLGFFHGFPLSIQFICPVQKLSGRVGVAIDFLNPTHDLLRIT